MAIATTAPIIANSKEREGGRVIARRIPVITADPSRRE
jgi:hypothetical protein